MSIEGVSGDAGRWGNSPPRKAADVEQKRAGATGDAPPGFDAALRYGAGETPPTKGPDVSTVDLAGDHKTTDGLDRLTRAQRNAVLNRNAPAPAPVETTAPATPMAPQPLTADELARRRALDAIAAYKRNSTSS